MKVTNANLLFFSPESWYSKLKIDVGRNWRLKGIKFGYKHQSFNRFHDIQNLFTASNMKKIMETVTEYYSEVLNITLNEDISPNVMRIAEKSDQLELGRFLQLVLG